MSKVIKVTRAQVNAAKRIVERSAVTGEVVSPAVRKMADAKPTSRAAQARATQDRSTEAVVATVTRDHVGEYQRTERARAAVFQNSVDELMVYGSISPVDLKGGDLDDYKQRLRMLNLLLGDKESRSDKGPGAIATIVMFTERIRELRADVESQPVRTAEAEPKKVI